MTTPTDLDHLEKLHAEATANKIESIRKYHTERAGYGGAGREFHVHAECLLNRCDEARNALPALIAEVRALRGNRSRLRASLQVAIDELADLDDDQTIPISDRLIAIMRDL